MENHLLETYPRRSLSGGVRRHPLLATAAALALGFALPCCSSGSSPASTGGGGSSSGAGAGGASGSAIDPTAIPVGDGKVSTSPKVGYVDSCTTSFKGGGAEHVGPWLDSATGTIADKATGSSTLVGYAADGYGIYLERDANGNLLTNADLDECHGRTSKVLWNGTEQTVYHYDATLEYPYTIGCFHGTPINTHG